MSNPVIEKFSTLLPRQGQGKRVMKSKLLTALGATGVLSPFPANPEHILERKILLQNAFNTNPSPPPVVSNGLLAMTLAYWKMDETEASGNRADATGNGWTATDVTASIANGVGIINNGANVDTRSKGLSVSHNLDIRAQTAPFAVSFWIHASSGGGFWFSGSGVVANKNPTVTAGWLIYPDLTTQTTFMHWYTTNDAVTASDITCTTSLDGNLFHHIVAGYDGTNKFFYQDGVLDASFPVAVPGVSRQQVLSIGNYAAFGANQGQPGIFDEMAYFNAMPTAAQVALLYNGGAGLPFSSYS